jgi:hypothetical protein
LLARAGTCYWIVSSAAEVGRKTWLESRNEIPAQAPPALRAHKLTQTSEGLENYSAERRQIRNLAKLRSMEFKQELLKDIMKDG